MIEPFDIPEKLPPWWNGFLALLLLAFVAVVVIFLTGCSTESIQINASAYIRI